MKDPIQRWNESSHSRSLIEMEEAGNAMRAELKLARTVIDDLKAHRQKMLNETEKIEYRKLATGLSSHFNPASRGIIGSEGVEKIVSILREIVGDG